MTKMLKLFFRVSERISNIRTTDTQEKKNYVGTKYKKTICQKIKNRLGLRVKIFKK